MRIPTTTSRSSRLPRKASCSWSPPRPISELICLHPNQLALDVRMAMVSWRTGVLSTYRSGSRLNGNSTFLSKVHC